MGSLTRKPAIERIEGSVLPDTYLEWVSDGEYVNGLLYEDWTLECRELNNPLIIWTKTVGITGADARIDCGPSVVIEWANNDLGALVPGEYLLELTGLSEGRARKLQFKLSVVRQIA